MSQNPFMQLYVGDYLADTLDLTTEQHGAYLLLLMTMWRHDAKLPNDPAKLARIARISVRRWHLVWSEIQHFFYVDGDQIRNKRLDREHQKAASISEKRSASGAAGGRAKAMKDNEPRVAKANDLPQHSQKSEPEKRKTEAKASAKKRSQLPEEWRLPSEWGEWALAKGMDELSVRREAEQFANHHQSRATLMADWRKAWQTWVNNNIKWKAERSTPAAKAGVPQIGDVREYPNGVRKQYAGVGTGWIVLHA